MRYFTNRAGAEAPNRGPLPLVLTTLLAGMLAACGGGGDPLPPVSTA